MSRPKGCKNKATIHRMMERPDNEETKIVDVKDDKAIEQIKQEGVRPRTIYHFGAFIV